MIHAFWPKLVNVIGKPLPIIVGTAATNSSFPLAVAVGLPLSLCFGEKETEEKEEKKEHYS